VQTTITNVEKSFLFPALSHPQDLITAAESIAIVECH
jgi:hypothetical protein